MDDVYEPREDSELLERIVRECARGSCIDVGTGSGIQAFAALENPDVTSVLAVDKNPAAIERVKERIAALPHDSRTRISAVQSDLFANVPASERFDTIICNPPYLPDEEKDDDPALYGGPGGYEWIVRFLDHATQHLAPGGQILLLFSSLSNKERVDTELKRRHLLFEELALVAMFFERLYVYRIRKVSP
jgi:release factor glutamine methyltransferase